MINPFKYLRDAHAAIELINSARRAPDKLLWKQGLRLGKTSRGHWGRI
jgi:hypothetical protein